MWSLVTLSPSRHWRVWASAIETQTATNSIQTCSKLYSGHKHWENVHFRIETWSWISFKHQTEFEWNGLHFCIYVFKSTLQRIIPNRFLNQNTLVILVRVLLTNGQSVCGLNTFKLLIVSEQWSRCYLTWMCTISIWMQLLCYCWICIRAKYYIENGKVLSLVHVVFFWSCQHVPRWVCVSCRLSKSTKYAPEKFHQIVLVSEHHTHTAHTIPNIKSTMLQDNELNNAFEVFSLDVPFDLEHPISCTNLGCFHTTCCLQFAHQHSYETFVRNIHISTTTKWNMVNNNKQHVNRRTIPWNMCTFHFHC